MQLLTQLQRAIYAVEGSLFLQRHAAAVISIGGCKVDIFCRIVCFLLESFHVWSCGDVSSGKSNSHGGGGVSSLRVLRLLRVFRSLKLLRQVEGLNKIVNIVLKVSSGVLCMSFTLVEI